MKTELTIQESGRLIELGVDAKLASYERYEDTGRKHCGIELPPEIRPIFGLTDILSILPKEIGNYELNINSTEVEHFVSYILWDSMDDCTYIRDVLSGDQFYATELIDALYQLLIWAIEHGYINTENHG